MYWTDNIYNYVYIFHGYRFTQLPHNMQQFEDNNIPLQIIYRMNVFRNAMLKLEMSFEKCHLLQVKAFSFKSHLYHHYSIRRWLNLSFLSKYSLPQICRCEVKVQPIENCISRNIQGYIYIELWLILQHLWNLFIVSLYTS